MKITYLQSPEALIHESQEWDELKSLILSEKPDVLVTNEMPFGKWLAANKRYNSLDAEVSITAHNNGIDELIKLSIPLVLSSRPLKFDSKLVNEGFALIDDKYHFVHHKQYFPNELGFYETDWFHAQNFGFNLIKTKKLNVGFLLCTEIMFNEWARAYGRQGAHLIVVPRASGQNFKQWKTAASMAAIVSGCYVVSSNRVGKFNNELTFGGKGFAYSPDGVLISETSSKNTVVSFNLDINQVHKQQKTYPCYVNEIRS